MSASSLSLVARRYSKGDLKTQTKSLTCGTYSTKDKYDPLAYLPFATESAMPVHHADLQHHRHLRKQAARRSIQPSVVDLHVPRQLFQ